jgi:hypothetical protein
MGMIDRARTDGRVVAVDQLINPRRGAAETVRKLWKLKLRLRRTTLRAGSYSMISSTGNTQRIGSPNPHTGESGDREQNLVNRQKAAVGAARAVAGLNRLRLRKRRQKNPAPAV